jgi:hypothetical protein
MILKPEEYAALKAAGLISFVKRPNGDIRIKVDRGEREDLTKDALLAWIEAERAPLVAALATLDAIEADIITL